MSQQITEAFRQQFADNFMALSQQMESRFQSCVRVESGIKGASKSVNRLGPRVARKRTQRHADTPQNDQPHSTRFVDIYDYEDGDLVDDQDLIRTLIDPTSDYTKLMVAAHNRAKDDEIIAALGGAARSTVAGVTVALPSAQKIAVGGTGMTKAKILAAKTLFRRNECDEENGEELYMAYHATAITDILAAADTTLTSQDFMSLKMLQEGSLKGKWCGFNWIPSERLPKVSTTRYCYAWAKTGVVLGIGADVKVRVAEDPGKSFSTRVYTSQTCGAVRTEEEKVVEIACSDP